MLILTAISITIFRKTMLQLAALKIFVNYTLCTPIYKVNNNK